MKFDVHCAPSVNVWLPGLIVADPAGAQAAAAAGSAAAMRQQEPGAEAEKLLASHLRFLRSDPPGPHARSVRRPLPDRPIGETVEPALRKGPPKMRPPMGNSRTPAIIAGALLVAAIVAFFVLRDSDSDDDSTTPAATTTSTAQAADENGQGGGGRCRGRQARGRRRLRREPARSRRS